MWAQKENNHWSNNYTNKSVLDMLPSDLKNELKTPSKYINIWDESTRDWKEQIINDKLFLLSPVEMGKASHEEEEQQTVTYSYYGSGAAEI